MSEFTKAIDILMINATDVIEKVSQGDGSFTFKDFLYTLMRENQKAYIELLYLCRDHQYPFNSAHQLIGKRLRKILGDDYTNSAKEGTTFDIFHNRTTNYVYRKME